MKLAPVAASSLVLLGSIASAQWTQEPEAVFGLKLGGPVQMCMEAPEAAPCLWKRIGNTAYYEVQRLPDLGFKFAAIAKLRADRLEVISLRLAHDDFGRMSAILVERYGKPHSDEAHVVANRAGARFPSRVLRWTGPKAAIQAKEHDGKIDTAGVTFYFSPMAEDVLRERDENVKAGASKL